MDLHPYFYCLIWLKFRILHKMLLSICVFTQSVMCRPYFSYGPRRNYIYSRTTKLNDILKVKNVLVHSVNYVTEYTTCKLLLLLRSGSPHFSLHSRHLTNMPHPHPKRKRTALSSQLFCPTSTSYQMSSSVSPTHINAS
jgi:hypothetical protein